MKFPTSSLPLLLAPLLSICQAEDGATEEGGFMQSDFMQNDFFKMLYDLLPDVEQWVVLVIFGSAALVVLIVSFCFLQWLCSCGKARKSRAEKTAEYNVRSYLKENPQGVPADATPDSSYAGGEEVVYSDVESNSGMQTINPELASRTRYDIGKKSGGGY
mmetsp:Transcript_7552/g.11523  ORF Transcript_7552/g.11523 Transcript_7552/m.11523 type:complete len:160 (-) Transcript_7552:229-708(-)